MTAYDGVKEEIHVFSTSTLDGGERPPSRHDRFTPICRSVTYTSQRTKRTSINFDTESSPLLQYELHFTWESCRIWAVSWTKDYRTRTNNDTKYRPHIFYVSFIYRNKSNTNLYAYTVLYLLLVSAMNSWTVAHVQLQVREKEATFWAWGGGGDASDEYCYRLSIVTDGHTVLVSWLNEDYLLPQKPTVAQVVKKFSFYYGGLLKRPCHLILPEPDEFSPHPLKKHTFNILLPPMPIFRKWPLHFRGFQLVFCMHFLSLPGMLQAPFISTNVIWLS